MITHRSEFARAYELAMFIRDRSLLSYLSEPQIQTVLKKARVKEVRAGDCIEDRSFHTVYIVCSGEIGIYSAGSQQKLGVIRAGKSIELDTLLSGEQRWRHTWTAESDSEILILSWENFRECLDQQPDLMLYLARIVNSAGLQRLKNDLLLCGMGRKGILKIFALLEKAPRTEASFLPGNLYILDSGRVGVGLKDKKAATVWFAAGDYFFLGPEQKVFTVSGNCEFWRLPTNETEVGVLFPKMLQRVLVPAKEEDTQSSSDPRTKEAQNPRTEEELLEIHDFTNLDGRKALKPTCVFQRNEMDCGAACLSTIARAYGRKIHLSAIRPLVNMSRNGTSLLSLQKAAKKIGFDAIGVSSSLTGLTKLRMPLISLMHNHFVVVWSCKNGRVSITDPATGILTYDTQRFERDYSGFSLLLRPTEDLYKFPESRSAYLKYLDLYAGSSKTILAIFLMAASNILWGVSSPILMQFGLDRILHGTPEIGAVFAAMLCAILLSGGSQWLQSYFMNFLSSRIETKLSFTFVRHLFALPLGYFSSRRPGDFITRLGDLSRVQRLFVSEPVILSTNVGMVIICSLLIGVYCPRILLLVLSAIPILIGVIACAVFTLTDKKKLFHEKRLFTRSMLLEQFQNLGVLRMLDGLIASRWRWTSSVSEALEAEREMHNLGRWWLVLIGITQSGLTTLVLAFACILLARNELSLGQLMAVTLLSGQIVGPLFGICSQALGITDLKISIDRIDDVVTANSESNDLPENTHPLQGDIEFRTVSFRYGGEDTPTVLCDINFSIRAGETVSLIGPSGCGKSTLVQLINGLYHPTIGQILLDGLELSHYSLKQIRANVCLLLQDSRLIPGTIYDNITMGDKQASIHRVVSAAKAAVAQDFIEEVGGYQTLVGDGGISLSGGQAQRIIVARALYRNSEILILDEATTAVDGESEASLIQNLRSYRSGKTTIVISHLPNPYLNPDRIIELKEGGRVSPPYPIPSQRVEVL